MKPSAKLLLSLVAGILAVVLMGVYALSLAGSFNASRQAAIEEYGSQDIVEIVVARVDIGPKTRVTEDMVEKRTWVRELLPQKCAVEVEDVVGQQTNAKILAGEPIPKSRLGEPDASSVSIPEGLYAVSIPTQDVLAVGGAVRQGSKVDLVVFKEEGETFILAKDVLVLATSADASRLQSSSSGGGLTGSAARGSSEMNWVTLAVEKGFVIPVVNASESARIHLTMSASGSSASTGGAEPTPVESTDTED